MNKLFLLILSAAFLFIGACKKNAFITGKDARINFSSDTLFFDTVFTTTGSVTRSVKITNSNDQKLLLSDIRLMGGSNSLFKINIDGVAATSSANIEIAANDSLYVFVSVFINPSSADLPFILQDSIQVSFNGNQQYIQLQAYGQNARFMRNAIISTDTEWDNTLPYVIVGGLQVNENTTLTIDKGCNIYLHADAPFLVNGTLIARGDTASRINFKSDRLDDPYKNYPGSWPGIIFNANAKDNILSYAIIKNAYQGIIGVGASPDANPKITLEECIIDNIYDAGIFATQTSLSARNCLITNCGKNIVLTYGGNYDFTHCTVASYSNDFINHTNPVLNINNFFSSDPSLSAPTNAQFLNCIFWGDNGTVDDEVVVSKQGSDAFQVGFAYCLWKTKNSPTGIDTTHILLNTDPMFDSVNTAKNYFDFHLKDSSPAVGYGNPTGIATDLDGKPRTVAGKTDLGCYQKQP